MILFNWLGVSNMVELINYLDNKLEISNFREEHFNYLIYLLKLHSGGSHDEYQVIKRVILALDFNFIFEDGDITDFLYNIEYGHWNEEDVDENIKSEISI